MYMLLELALNNFRLFKGKNKLSFVGDKRTKALMSKSYVLDNRNVLKTMTIYGPNNSGKSNICSLLKIIKEITAGDFSFQMNRSFSMTIPSQMPKLFLIMKIAWDGSLMNFVMILLLPVLFMKN